MNPDTGEIRTEPAPGFIQVPRHLRRHVPDDGSHVDLSAPGPLQDWAAKQRAKAKRKTQKASRKVHRGPKRKSKAQRRKH